MKPAVRLSTTRRAFPADAVAFVAATAALLMWSGTTTANKIAVADVDGFTVGILRSALAGVLAIVFVTALRVKPPATRRHLALVAISGVASFAIWPALLSTGLTWTTASHAGLVMALIPVMTVLFAKLRQHRLPGTRWWAGALVALSATVTIMLGRGVTFATAENGAGLVGDLIVFSGCAICAVGYVAGGRMAASFGAPATTLWGLIAALFVTVPILTVVVPRTDWRVVTPVGWTAIAYLTVVSSLLGYGLWFFALGRGGVHRIGSLQLAMPVTGLVVAALVLGETIGSLTAVAAVVLIAGTWVAHRNA